MRPQRLYNILLSLCVFRYVYLIIFNSNLKSHNIIINMMDKKVVSQRGKNYNIPFQLSRSIYLVIQYFHVIQTTFVHYFIIMQSSHIHFI